MFFFSIIRFMENKLKIGIIGLGTVGTGVVKVLQDFPEIEIVGACVKNTSKKREVEVKFLTDDPFMIANHPEIDIVVEVAGGVNPMREVLKTAIRNKKHIVTANKELLAKHGAELFDLANENNVVILYEAAVAGGIPIISPIKNALRANKFTRVAGILNGTTNYILTKMEQDQISYGECLKRAQELGYAETDPTGDVEGFDTMYKIATLANIVFGKRIDVNKIYREGITKISDDDIKHAEDLGYKIKLIGLAQVDGDALDIRVHPMLIPVENVISLIDNALNAVQLEGMPVGQIMFTGPGAGEFPTASSVVGDILAIKSEINTSDFILPLTRCNHKEYANQLNILDTKSCYYISINAENRVGTIGLIGSVCAKNSINLSNIVQKGIKQDGTAQVIVVTEIASECDMQNALTELREKGIVINNLIRAM